ncbi:hypothetical protein KTAU_01020 [Thermogemmatispora aurantia]|uniref:Uncharacterized protein n=1 Tax=Thermogemmatispora aurantia TaxID=2045279 RepID=A0A5J4K0M6_9CHLR|nr:hypothetical protein KTAU_01020 [Thermogemmatispora aurantia]
MERGKGWEEWVSNPHVALSHGHGRQHPNTDDGLSIVRAVSENGVVLCLPMHSGRVR